MDREQQARIDIIESYKDWQEPDNIEYLRPFIGKSRKKQIPIQDPVFFKKDQLKIGSKLIYYGRHDPNAIWEVSNIYYFSVYKGKYRGQYVTSVQKLNDAISLICIKGKDKGQRLELTFQYLSYSAIWRLA